MNAAQEGALVTLLMQHPPLQAMVDDRVTWDTEEVDLGMPSVTLRLLAGVPSARDLGSRGGVIRCLVEIAANAEKSTPASEVLDAVVGALTPYESGPFSVGLVRFGGIHLDDVTQSQPARAHAYRKAARFIVVVYE